MASRIEGNLTYQGAVSYQGTVTLPSETVTNANIRTAAGISADKLEHQFSPVLSQSGTAVGETKVVHVVNGETATVLDFSAGMIAHCTGDATVTLDLKKNGVSILTGTVGLSSAQSNYQTVAATIASAGLVAGDVLSVVVTVNAGTGSLGTGLFYSAVIREGTA